MLSSTRPSLKTCYAKPVCSRTSALAKRHARSTGVSKLIGSACSAALRPDTTALERTTCASTATITSGIGAISNRLSKTAMASIVRSVSRIHPRREIRDKAAASRWAAGSADPRNSHSWRTRNFNRLSLQKTCLRLTCPRPKSSMSENQ